MNKRNATASWSGYLHQGKIGILIALIKINHLLDKGSSLKNWMIEYESAEDIDIKDNERVDSRHQVKANKYGIFPNDYKEVLLEREVEIKDGKEKIIRVGFQIQNASGEILEVNENSRFLHTIKEVKGFDLDKKTFEERYPRSNYIENPNKIQLYTYPNGKKFCNISDGDEDGILKFCKDEIKKILNREQKHPFKTDDNEHENIFKHLLWILDEQIRKKHHKGSEFFPVMKFEDIHVVITSTTSYKQSNLDKIREIFSKSWTEFINEISDEDYYTEEKIEEVSGLLKQLYTLSEEDFIQFMKDMNPDQTNLGDFSNITDVINVCNVNSFKDIFYECLLLVTEQEFNLIYKGYRSEISSTSYLLTLIDRPKKRVGNLISNMKKNKEVTDNIFNREYLINGRIDGVRFGEDITTSPEKDKTNNNWKKDMDQKEKFYNPNLEFISVDNAIEKLNERLDYDA